MSLAELIPSVQALPRSDKYRLMQELITELSQEDGLAAGEYPVWSPLDSYAAAAVLMDLLAKDKAHAA